MNNRSREEKGSCCAKGNVFAAAYAEEEEKQGLGNRAGEEVEGNKLQQDKKQLHSPQYLVFSFLAQLPAALNPL
jgi:hypothetical protein